MSISTIFIPFDRSSKYAEWYIHIKINVSQNVNRISVVGQSARQTDRMQARQPVRARLLSILVPS